MKIAYGKLVLVKKKKETAPRKRGERGIWTRNKRNYAYPLKHFHSIILVTFTTSCI